MTTFYLILLYYLCAMYMPGALAPEKGPTKWEGPPAYTWRTILLPQEIIERIAAGVDFGYHLVEVSTKLVYTYLLTC